MSALAITETSYELPLRPFTAEQLQRAFAAGLFAPGQVALRGDMLIDCATGKSYLWPGEEYDAAIEIGVFHEGERAELIGGEVRLKVTLEPPHVYSVRASEEAMRSIFGPGFDVRAQITIRIDPHSRPEPDVAVVRGSFRDYRFSHPTTALLVIEVADTTYYTDSRRKASLYAFAGILDYWILNLPKRVLEARRHPVVDASQEFGFGYEEVTVYTETEMVSPLAAPGSFIAVADLLP